MKTFSKAEKRRKLAIRLIAAKRWLQGKVESGDFLTPGGVKIILDDISDALAVVDRGGKVQALIAQADARCLPGCSQ